jgi:predicted MPP superfamily phosphohydrolase
VDLRGLLGLNDPFGFVICLAGFFGQVWLTRKNKRLFKWSVAVAVSFFLVFEALAEIWFPRLNRLIGTRPLAWFNAWILIWCLCMGAIAIAISIRDRIPKFSRSRRAMLASTTAICAAPAAVFVYGILSRKNTVIREVEIKLRGLPSDLQNVRIVQISDIHLSAFFSERDLIRVIDAANDLRGDIAIMTGDLITTHGDPLEAGIRQLSRLKNTSGIWGCMGNHEHFARVENLAAKLGARAGVRFLRSQAVPLKFGKNTINLVGVDFQSMHFPYLVGAEELVESDQFNLLLSHNPDVFPVAIKKGFDLVLAGHTHGGQINIEIFNHNLNVADFITPYTKGLYTKENSAIYVNSGIGTIGMPVRLGAPPEITLIKLCAS